MKKILVVLAAIAIVFVGLNFAKNNLFQTIMTSALSQAAHVPVRIGSTSVRFLSASILIRQLHFLNPKGFPERKMVDISRIYIDFEPAALWKGQAHFEEVKLDLKEIIVIKNRDGRLNVDAVKPREKKASDTKQKKGSGLRLRIDRLHLSVGRVVYKDYSKGSEPKIEVFDVNMKDREYRNIEDPSALVSLIMFETLTRTAVGRLANLDLGDFEQGFLGQLQGGTGKVEQVAQGLLNLFK
jgi:uncharacterized protein involved in outer membrane biogenesis